MPTTRTQAAKEEAAKAEKSEEKPLEAGEKRADPDSPNKADVEEPPKKRAKADEGPQTGVIERGHIYFFYRPRVELEEAESLDDVKNLHMLLVPRPPLFTQQTEASDDLKQEEADEMRVLEPGADAVPAAATTDVAKKYRLITIGKKQLPDPSEGGKGRGRKPTFWATVSAVGDDIKGLAKDLGPNEYETKTRGTRHNAAARLTARGLYAIVNNEPRVPSERTTHLAYALTHPSPENIGEVQRALGLQHTEASFVLQVKNPNAPASARAGIPSTKTADYPDEIMNGVFGLGGRKGKEEYGLRFVSCERPELLDYQGAQLLLIGAHGGRSEMDESLGQGRGEAIARQAEEETQKLPEQVFRELALDSTKFPAEPLEEGVWA